MNLKALEKVAQEYRDDGYDVRILPSGTELPEFLQRFSPDLVAVRGHEHVVVEVSDRESLRDDSSIAYVAAEVNAQPGWRFDLVLQPTDASFDPLLTDSTEPTGDYIFQLTDAAERLVAMGELAAACMVAWSSTEAAIRRTAEQAGVDLESKEPQYVLNAMATEGLLSQDDYSTLTSILSLRNTFAHGLRPASMSADAPEFLVDMTRRLLRVKPAHASAL